MEPFKVHILGCGSALPTLRHYPSMQVVECRGKLFMIDCGEGAQLQVRRASLSFNRIGHIFISHLHGDHCFGLMGMISTFGLLGRTAPLHIYGPPQLRPILTQQIEAYCDHNTFSVEIHDVDTTVFQIVYEDRSLTVKSIPLEHRIPCCGYLFEEKPTLPHIRRDMLECYEIPLSQIGNIKAGQGYTLPDGTHIAHERLVEPASPPRSYAYCSDTRFLPQLGTLLRGTSTIYHESTYTEAHAEMAENYYHSTARQAASVAKEAQARQLILGHYSSRYDNEQQLLHEAQDVFENSVLSHEMDVIDV